MLSAKTGFFGCRDMEPVLPVARIESTGPRLVCFAAMVPLHWRAEAQVAESGQLIFGGAIMNAMRANAPALAGAAAGGVLGYFAFVWLLSMGLYGLILPGGLLGLAAGTFKNRSIAVAVVCSLAALLLGLFAEWKSFPFKADDSFGYFLSHFYELQPMTLVMIALGAVIGFWVPFRRREPRFGLPRVESLIPPD